jgi:hypothetical protein
MARRREEEQPRLLERGEVAFYVRPQAEDDFERTLIALSPADGRMFRVIAVGRKKMSRDRFWGFVDLILYARQDLEAALGAQTYGTKMRGVRHVPAAQKVAGGNYSLSWHEGHAHLQWEVPDFEDDLIVTVANPDPAAWGLFEMPPLQSELFDEAELHVTLPTPFPPALQARFNGLRFTPLDSVEFLNHPGAELVFIPAYS